MTSKVDLVLRRLRRPAALLAPLLLVPTLAACGSEGPGELAPTAERLDAVTVSGEEGADPTFEWNERMAPADGLESETVVEGDGAALEEGDSVLINYAIGNGYTQQTAVDSFGPDAAGAEITIGGAPVEPQTIEQFVAGFVQDNVEAGTTRGTRLLFTGNTADLFPAGAYSSALFSEDIGNDDPLVLVVDLLDTEILDAPDGARSAKPAWAPTLTYTKGRLTGYDWDGVEQERGLDSAFLIRGEGPEVESGDLLVADYFGAVYDSSEPFDSSFAADREPISTPIGLGQVVQGWDKELVGVPVGSRVILRIPPADGYGQQEQNGIPAGSTLYFVVDVLAAV